MAPDLSEISAYQMTASATKPLGSDAPAPPPAFNPRLGPLTRSTFSFLHDPAAAARTSVYLPAHGGDVRMAVNGQIISDRDSGLTVRLNRYLSASSAIVEGRPGANVLVVEQFNNPTAQTVHPVYVGPAAQMEEGPARYIGYDRVVQAMALLSIVTAIFMSMVLVFFAQQPSRYFCLFVMFVLILIIRYESQWTLFGEPVIRLINYVGSLCQLMGFLAVSFWTGGPPKERRYAGAIFAAITAMLAIADTIFGLDSAQTVLFRISVFAIPGIATACFVIKRVRDVASSLTQETQIVFAIVAALALSFLINIVSLYVPVSIEIRYLTAVGSRVLTSLCLVALSAFALYFEVARYRTALRGNASMGEIMAGHNLELGAQTLLLKSEIERRAVLEERQRFTRDMHDGIGGQLLSLLLKARSGQVAMEEVERDVAQSLNDLRLVAASLDGADEGLVISLASFRARAADQLDAAGVVLDWQEVGDIGLVNLDPRQTLDLLRILQEAVTNVIRHAGASKLNVRVTFDPVEKRLILALVDNGTGVMPPLSAAKGQGIENMKARAARLGAAFTIGAPPGQNGTQVEMTLVCQTLTVSRTG